MKIKMYTKDFEATIKKLDLVRPNKATDKVLENIMIVAENNSVTLISTDLENSIEIVLDAEIEEEGTVILGNIANIKKSFKYFKDYQTTITTDNSDLILINGTKKIENPIIKDQFPELPQLKDALTYTYNTLALVNRIKKVAPAIAKDEIRPILTGIHFNSSDILALDGYRMHLNKDYNLEVNKSFTAKGKTLEIFTKLIGKKDDYNLNILVDEKQIKLQYDNITLTGRLLEGEYVNYNQIIPRDYKTKVTINKEELQENIEFLGTYDKLIKFDINKDVQLKSNNENGIYKTDINSIDFEGDEIFFAANNKYLIDALKCIDDKNISIELIKPESPIVFKNATELYLILPVRLAHYK